MPEPKWCYRLVRIIYELPVNAVDGMFMIPNDIFRSSKEYYRGIYATYDDSNWTGQSSETWEREMSKSKYHPSKL